MEGFTNLWKSRHHPTAIVAMSDIIAIGVIKAAMAAGLRVPQDLSVVGFDNITLASLIQPALTTVAQPSREKGEIAAMRTGQIDRIPIRNRFTRCFPRGWSSAPRFVHRNTTNCRNCPFCLDALHSRWC
jgi:DNA-binding LacI/PurR family transcriptional regulator